MDLYEQAVQLDAPTGDYILGDASGTSAADTGSSPSAGTYSGGFTLNQAGAVASNNIACAAFDGTGYVSTTRAAGGALTIEALINPTAYAATQSCIIGSGFAIYTGNKFMVTGANVLTSYVPPLNTWSYLVATSDASANVVAYAGNTSTPLAQVGTSTGVGISFSSGDFRIAGRQDVSGNSSFSFHGRIGRVAIYPAVLSLAKLQTHFNAWLLAAAACGAGVRSGVRR